MDLSRDRWKQEAKKMWDELGNVTSIDAIIPENQLRGRFRIHGEKKDVDIFFTLTPERSPKIQQLDFVAVDGK
jgi:hypothetical protein